MFTRKRRDRKTDPAEHREFEFESVEVSFEGIECSHQFRIWNGDPHSMFVLVKHSSEIVDRFKVGEVVKMKYYTHGSDCRTKMMDTKIQEIIKEEQGRFRGHYVVGLALAESGQQVA
jgi:hypothetical protein